MSGFGKYNPKKQKNYHYKIKGAEENLISCLDVSDKLVIIGTLKGDIIVFDN